MPRDLSLTPGRRGEFLCTAAILAILAGCGGSDQGDVKQDSTAGEQRSDATESFDAMPVELTSVCRAYVASETIAGSRQQRGYRLASAYADVHPRDARALYLRGTGAASLLELGTAADDFREALALGLPRRQAGFARAMLGPLGRSLRSTDLTGAIAFYKPLGRVLLDLEEHVCPGAAVARGSPATHDSPSRPAFAPVRTGSQIVGHWNVLPQPGSAVQVEACEFSETSYPRPKGISGGEYSCVTNLLGESGEVLGVWRLERSRLSLEVSGNTDVHVARISETGDRLRLVNVADGTKLVLQPRR